MKKPEQVMRFKARSLLNVIMGLSHKIQAGARKGNTKQARWKKRF
jgi:hypothetical protein